MRVPTRENRYFLSPAQGPSFGRRDERVPSLATAAKTARAKRELAEAYAEIRRDDARERERDQTATVRIVDGAPVSAGFASLLQEVLWSRVLKKHGLDDEA